MNIRSTAVIAAVFATIAAGAANAQMTSPTGMNNNMSNGAMTNSDEPGMMKKKPMMTRHQRMMRERRMTMMRKRHKMMNHDNMMDQNKMMDKKNGM